MKATMTIEALRTPDDRFAFMPGYPQVPAYIEDLEGYEARHFVQEDIPEAYNRALTDWLRDQF